MTFPEFMEQFPNGIAVVVNDWVVHAVGYPKPPQQTDMDHLREELASDEEIGLTDLTDYELVIVTGEEWVNLMSEYFHDH
jgi:hypothetical protein